MFGPRCMNQGRGEALPPWLYERRAHFARFWGRETGGFGRERERMFDPGDLQLVILHFVGEKPSYGYEIMKAIENRVAGEYVPSPGVVYPTLTMLEEEGYALVTPSEAGKKVYAITDEGRKYLEKNRHRVEEIFVRLEQAGNIYKRGRSPQIMRALVNLRSAVKARVSREKLSSAEIKRIAEAIDQAARTIADNRAE